MAVEMPVSQVVYREDLYPRRNADAATIQRYAENIDVLPPIEVSQQNILIDGYHRWKAYQTEKRETIPAIVTQVASEDELFGLSMERNAGHGLQLSQDDKRRLAVRYWNVWTDAQVIQRLSIGERTFRAWTADKRKQRDEDIKQRVYDLWLACHTHQSIAESIDVPRQTVSDRIAEFAEIGNDADLGIFRDFLSTDGDEEKSPLKVYQIWNFGKANNEVRHFGNIPPEIIDNLLWYYTKPFDVVFDPFGGGGSTIDVCKKRKRRYYVSDLNPIPAREQDIRQHDITTGLPEDLPVPDLVFLDPPYWKQAEGKYSQDATDLGNVDLEAFLANVGNIARDVKRKWSGAKREAGTLALIIGPWKDNGRYVDLPFLCYERIAKYLRLKQRIIVPYSTQVHGGAYVKAAKEKREVLYLARDLMVFEP